MFCHSRPFEAFANVCAYDLLERGIVRIAEFLAVSTVDGYKSMRWRI